MWQEAIGSIQWSDSKAVENPPRAFLSWCQKHSHSHDFNEILVTLSGEHFYGINGELFAFSPGIIALLPRRLPHDSGYSEHHAECIDFWIHILPHNKTTLNFIHHTPATGTVSVPVPLPSVSLLEDFRRAGALLDRMENHLDQQKAHHFVAYLLHELFGMIMDADSKSQTVNIISLVEGIKQYIMEHLTDSLSLSDLAVAAGYSSFHFHRLFLEAEGITPRNFVEGQRLKRACELLKAGQTVTSAAMDSGFSTYSQFTRVFKRQFQLSPSEWLKSTM